MVQKGGMVQKGEMVQKVLLQVNIGFLKFYITMRLIAMLIIDYVIAINIYK